MATHQALDRTIGSFHGKHMMMVQAKEETSSEEVEVFVLLIENVRVRRNAQPASFLVADGVYI